MNAFAEGEDKHVIVFNYDMTQRAIFGQLGKDEIWLTFVTGNHFNLLERKQGFTAVTALKTDADHELKRVIKVQPPAKNNEFNAFIWIRNQHARKVKFQIKYYH